MNLMRKLRGVGGRPADEPQNAEHNALGLMHLRKLFGEYQKATNPVSDQERNDKLYNMLPLFYKVFGNSPSGDMAEKFKELNNFCLAVSKLIVSEIRWRASDQSTEAASLAIVKFLEIENSEESSNGWMLLSTINLLSAGDASLITVMTSAAVPSTLVKCLYLFFDLPEMEDTGSDIDNNPSTSFTPNERRILLNKIFSQVLVRLCSHAGPAQELARKNDLYLLFSAITSWCSPCNVMWRKSAAEVLMTLSRHGLNQAVLTYIHNKGCIGQCIENMQRGQDLTALEVVEMFVSMFCCLKDSCDIAQTLLDDFRASQGYTFLTDFLLKLESGTSNEDQEALRNLVLMVSSLTMCGFYELKPTQASVGSLFQLEGFSLPQPSAAGGSVRNMQAFQVLQTVFLKSHSPVLCSLILDAISNIYHADNANYFILETQHTLPQFAEKIHTKTPEIQLKFFQQLEFIVFQLNFVPCKELISLSILLRSETSVPCSCLCMLTLLNILRHNAVFKDVYREVGLLEVAVTCLQRYATLLKEKQQALDEGREYVIPEMKEKLGQLTMEALTLLLAGNGSNAAVFRECGGARCAHNLVPYLQVRPEALGIVRELVLCSGADDDMATLLGMMYAAPPHETLLKTHILQALITCLRDSHRARTVFRKVGGFVYVMSVLVSMEGALSASPKPPWDTSPRSDVITLLYAVFNTLALAMRFEPANAKFFHQEIRAHGLVDSLRLLGCFAPEEHLGEISELTSSKEEAAFLALFSSNITDAIIPNNIPQRLASQCVVLRLMYDLALDLFDRSSAPVSFKSPAHRRHFSTQRSDDSPGFGRRSNVTSLNLTPAPPDAVIVHAGVVVSMLELIPALRMPENPQMSLSIQTFAAEIIKSLVRSERNQQVMCEAGLPGQLLETCKVALEDETHPIHAPLQYILERLASQSIEARELREFLRLGDPLSCVSMDDMEEILKTCPKHRVPGGPVPLTRIKTLVSMTTPRDVSCHGNSSALFPPFAEFDMSSEGFGCLYLPSIAPQSPAGPGVVTGALLSADNNVIGGIGAGDRIFPPQTGLTFSTWVCVDKFSDPRHDPHCVRLLTLVRNLQGRDEHLVCLCIVLSARDKAIIISTQETLMPHNLADWEPEGLGEGSARIWCPDLLQEGQWHHLAFVLNRAVLKNSSLSVYLDGQLIHSQKMHYISQNPGGGAANLTVASSVYAYIGTAPTWRRYSRLSWKQGPCHLVEEVLPPQTVQTIFNLGPQYMGSFQSPQQNGVDPLPPLIAEEKLVFGLNAKAVSQLTLAKIRKVYSRADNKSIAKQLGMSSHENGTPIRVLHNSVSHLSGPARSLGGVVVGYLGVRVFAPCPVAKVVEHVGGCSVLLGLIAMAQDVEALYAGVKALVCVVKANRPAQLEMDRRRQYQTLAMLLRKKKTLLNSHILHLMFSLVGTVDSGRESSSIPNVMAFQDLLCDLEVWHEAPGDLERSLLEHLLELVTESSEQRRNLRVLRDLQLVPRILFILGEVTSGPTRQVMLQLLGALIAQPRPVDLLWFGQFVVSTLPQYSPGMTEKSLDLKDPGDMHSGMVSAIVLRNRCLQLLHSLFFTPRQAVNITFCDEVSRVLGLDWLLLFMQPHLHTSTVIWALRILVVFGALPAMVAKFREGAGCGGWLKETELLSQNKMGVVLGCQLGTSTPTKLLPARLEMFGSSGFQTLSCLLTRHTDVTEVYFLIIALIMGLPVKLLPAEPKLQLNCIWNFMYGTNAAEGVTALVGKVTVCPDAIVTLLAMVRAATHQDKSGITSEVDHYPVTILEFLKFLYNNLPELMTVFMSTDVLTGLVSVLFPKEGVDSETSTPGDETPLPDDTVIVRTDSVHQPDSIAVAMVMDFLAVIVLDSLTLPINNKGISVIDLILDGSPDNCTSHQQISFQTDLLSSLMDRLVANDVLGEGPSTAPVPGGSPHNIPHNVVHVASRIVDKLWQDSIAKDPHEVFDFVVKLISHGKRKGLVGPLEGLYHCLNRTILYLLSRPTDSVADQMSVLEALHKITNHRSLILGVGNHELDFVGCLTYCLLQLTADMKIAMEGAKTTWHVNPNADVDDTSNARQGHNLMTVAAKRVWEELYVCKKPAIEEVFKVPLAVTNNRVPELHNVREQVLETATKIWLTYIDMERKSLYRAPLELQFQIQSKIQKVTGGLTRLASRSKVKKDEPARINKYSAIWTDEKQIQIQLQISVVRELVEMRARNHQLSLTHMQRYVSEEWLQTQTELMRERGLWGPTQPLKLEKWMLDMTEGPSRMRKKLTRNELFYLLYPYRAVMSAEEGKSLKHKVAVSRDSKEFYHKSRLALNMFASERENLLESQLPSIDATEPSEDRDVSAFHGMPLNRTVSESDEPLEDNELDSTTEEVSQPDNQTVLRLLERNEKISHMFRCVRVQGLDTTEGLLLFGKEYLYIIDGFTLLKSREIRDIEGVPPGEAPDPILPSTGSPRRTRPMRQCSKFSYEDVKEVHKRRYLLQPMALEVFSGDGRNYLLSFQRKVRNKVYNKFMEFATGISDSAQQSVAGQKRAAHVEQSAGILSGLIGETSVTQRWVRGEISNFQYLMHLNTLAGRSYNDLMQYPVFPWILADYDSEELDLTHSSTFRDFSHPMGAQTPDRLSQFKKRFKEWDDPHGETPPYHYGTHYSSAMIVCSYLVRMEPFAQHFLRLQGGHFDLADRMFHSIKEAWTSASKHNMADVKELIPEFFYLPEFLCNSNNFDLGVKQNGVELGHVVLPPWAKDDPREFIRVHRMALECDYVSQHLHEWIDLIFGHKQNGQPAVEAVNVFHHLFYEGNVDIYNIDDPLKKNATIGFINNFGQIPKQLFKKPHPAKKLGGSRTFSLDPGGFSANFAVERYFFHHLDNLKPSMLPVKELKGPVGQILCSEKSLLAVEQNKCLMPPSYTKYVAWGFPDHSLRIGQYDSDKVVLVCEEPLGEIVCCACPSSRIIITAGTDSVVTIWDVTKRSLSVKQCLYGHLDAVTCLAACPAFNVIVSGSRDKTAIVWDMSRKVFVRQLTGHSAPLAAVAVNDLTGDMATCAGTWLHLWSINGTELARVNTCVGRADRMQQILCVAFSTANEWDPLNVVITGSTDGVVRMWSLDYVQVPKEETPPSPAKKPASEVNAVVDPDESVTEAKDEQTEGNDLRKNRIHSLVQQMSMSAEYKTTEDGPIVKSGSESSLSEDGGNSKEGKEEEKELCSDKDEEDEDVDNQSKKDCKNALGRVKRLSGDIRSKSEELSEQVDLLSEPKYNIWRRPSCKGDLHRQEAMRRESLLGSSAEASVESPLGSPVVRRRKNSAARNQEFRKSEGFTTVPDEINADDQASRSAIADDSRLRPSKSDTSLTDSFVMVGSSGEACEKVDMATVLRDGFRWQRQLLFRSKLTMHTAFDRKDNATPASITALAVSKEQRCVHVGDTRGRVFTWSVAEQPGRSMADHWLKDEGADTCHSCHVKFSLYERKHHCRNCGQVFCSKCSRFESEISRLRILRPVRVCQGCYSALKMKESKGQS